MIVIKNLCGGRFGNKILHYNNLVQLATAANTDWNSVHCQDYTYLNLKNDFSDYQKFKTLEFKDIRNIQDFTILKDDYYLTPCLGEMFFLFNHPTREIFKIEPIFDDSIFRVGICFRGTDFHGWNPESILPTSYYMNAIDVTPKGSYYYIATDDRSLKSYNDVLKYLKEKNIPHEVNIGISHMEEFKNLCNMDMLISSPSTFHICSGIMGKEKTIIHSEKWVENRASKNDMFWVGVKNGGNDNYRIYKLI